MCVDIIRDDGVGEPVVDERGLEVTEQEAAVVGVVAGEEEEEGGEAEGESDDGEAGEAEGFEGV